MPEYTFDPARAAAIVEQLEMVNKRIKLMLQNLDEESRRNLKEWSSDTKVAYDQAKASWDASAAAMPVALTNARSALGQISQTYGRMEQNGQSLFGG
jgi:WXG100 family type VII secretion target